MSTRASIAYIPDVIHVFTDGYDTDDTKAWIEVRFPNGEVVVSIDREALAQMARDVIADHERYRQWKESQR